MDAHDVGRGRGGVAAALRRIEGWLVGVGIPGDLLYSPEDVREWVDAAGAEYREIVSSRGHDAFLLETEQVAEILGEALETAERGVGRANGFTATRARSRFGTDAGYPLAGAGTGGGR
jgi:hypothetical protein